jgi:hypothetical protein
VGRPYNRHVIRAATAGRPYPNRATNQTTSAASR